MARPFVHIVDGRSQRLDPDTVHWHGSVGLADALVKGEPGLLSVRDAVPAALAALAMMASLAGCELAQAPSDTSDIVIGADLELSGAAADMGAVYNRALELKVDQLNQQDVLGGRKIRLVVKDNRSDRTISQSNVAQLLDDSAVAALITGACSACAVTSAKNVNDRQMPTISLALADEVASPVAERQYVFKLGPNPKDGAAFIAAEMDRAGVERVGVLSTQDEYGSDGVTWLKRELGKVGIDIVSQAEARPTDTDLAQPVQGLVAAQPDALVLWTYPTQAASAAVGARRAGFRGRLFLDAAAAGDLFMAGEVASATNGAVMITTQTMAIDDVIANTPAKAVRKQWFRDYMSRYGGYNGYASFAADAVQMIVNAIAAAGGTDGERMRQMLETQAFDGLSGPIRMTPANHSGLMPQALTVLVARNGQWRLLS
jgi:branched-chain amino acid transport system substrate-binding protein